MSVCTSLKCLRAHISSHHLVLLPRPLEVYTAVLSALDDRPSTAGCFHVAIHLEKRERMRLEKHMYEGNGTMIAPKGLQTFLRIQKM